MVTFKEAAASAVKGALCAVLAINDERMKLAGRLSIFGGVSDYLNFFGPLRADLCNEEPIDPDPPEPPFTGGQCPGTIYRASWTTLRPGLPNNSFSADRPGPISISRALNPGDSDAGCPPGQTFNRFTLKSGGTDVGIDSGCGVELLSFNVEPLFGGPDDCGDPDIEIPAPGPVERPVNVTYNNEDNDIIDIDGDVTFAPFFSVGDLNLNAPFRLNLGGVEFSGTLQLSPTLEFNIAPRFSFGGAGGPDNPELPPSGDPGTPDDPDQDPDDPVIIGVIVRSQVVGEQRATSIALANQPDVYAPRIGSVSFAIQTSLVVAWTPDMDIKNLDCYIPCPAPQGAVGVGVDFAPGFTGSWTAVRGQPLTST